MAETNSANQAKPKKKSTNQGKSKNSKVEIVPWQSQEICIVENVNQCRDLASKLRSYVQDILNSIKMECFGHKI